MNASHISSRREWTGWVSRIPLRRGMAWGIIILAALLAFEIFNFSTTEFALSDVLGDLRFMGISWATILAIAFCGIDFAGIARLFTPQQGREEPAEVWYLFGAWLLAAAMNALLTWWGVSVAIINHNSLAGGVVVSGSTLTKVIPVFVAVMVWLIRVLIIGTFSVAGERLFSQAEDMQGRSRLLPDTSMDRPRPAAHSAAPVFQPAVKSARRASPFERISEPPYRNIAYQAQKAHEIEYSEDSLR